MMLPTTLVLLSCLAAPDSFQLTSRSLGETRTIDVALPSGYETNTDRRYPVIVVLDAEDEHEIAAAIARFYARMSQLPQTIVVGIRNTDRARDMTPAPVGGFRMPPEIEKAGGADRFLAFLADELLPHLDRTYRTTPMRVLVGHSLGGLFALHALAQRPTLFTGYVIMEPAAWWNNEHEFREARRVLQSPAARRARVMMVNTQGFGLDTTAWGGARPMIRHIRTTDETHASMAAAGMMHGLRRLFADWKPEPWRPGMRPIAMLDRYDSLAARIGYAVPIPPSAYQEAIRMSIDSRFWDDATRGLSRMEAAFGVTPQSRELREKLTEDRANQLPGFIQLEIPTARPTPHEARAFLGRWVKITATPADSHEVTFRSAEGDDTIAVLDRVRTRDGTWLEGNGPMIQVTADGTIEWGLPWFRGLAALLVLKGRIESDGTMTVTREARGWVPRGPGGDLTRTERFRRVN